MDDSVYEVNGRRVTSSALFAERLKANRIATVEEAKRALLDGEVCIHGVPPGPGWPCKECKQVAYARWYGVDTVPAVRPGVRGVSRGVFYALLGQTVVIAGLALLIFWMTNR